jgi:hypothetical protein
VVRRRVPGLTPLLAILLTLRLVGALLAVPAVEASDPGWSAYHHDGQRTGVDPTQTTAASINPGSTSPALDGKVYAEPLVDIGHVIVATEGNTVYSVNAGDGTIAWSQNLGPAVLPIGFPCGDINPIGITSTPVIDGTNGIVYAVAFLAPLHHELFALNLSTSAVLWHRTVDAPGADSRVHNQRGALVLSEGYVYVPFGGRAGDCGQYQGRVVASPVNGTGALLTYSVPTAREAGIWGPAVDPTTGDLLVSTGNSESTTTFDYGESVIRLSPSLSVLDYWAPSNWVALNQGDVDIGSVGPTILGNNRIFQAGKAGVGYLLAADHLGGVGGQVFSADVCAGGGVFGGTAYLAPYIYVPCNNGLAAVLVAPDGNSFSDAWRGPSGNAGPPIVSGGLVWRLYPGMLEASAPQSARLRTTPLCRGSPPSAHSPPAPGRSSWRPMAESGPSFSRRQPRPRRGWWRARAMPRRRWLGRRPPIPVRASPATSSPRRPWHHRDRRGGGDEGRGSRPDERNVLQLRGRRDDGLGYRTQLAAIRRGHAGRKCRDCEAGTGWSRPMMGPSTSATPGSSARLAATH